MTSDSNDYMPVVYRTRLVDAVKDKMVNKMEHKITVEFADKSGQSTQLMSPAERIAIAALAKEKKILQEVAASASAKKNQKNLATPKATATGEGA